MSLINKSLILLTYLFLSMKIIANDNIANDSLENNTIVNDNLYNTTITKNTIVKNSVSSVLNDFAWKKRQIIVFADNKENIQYQNFKEELVNLKTDINERNLHTWHIVGKHPVLLNSLVRGDVENQSFRDAYKVKMDEFRVLLVGYDQGEKLRQQDVSFDTLFSKIDQMPMRVREMEMELKSKQ